MRWLSGLFVTLFLVLQYQLWLGHGGVMTSRSMQHAIEQRKKVNEKYKKRNEQLMADIAGLKQGHQAIESRARHDLGMVKKGEVFYQVVK